MAWVLSDALCLCADHFFLSAIAVGEELSPEGELLSLLVQRK
jgi:hypothetical protein